MSKHQQTNLPVHVKQVEPIVPLNKRNMLYPVTTMIMLSSILILLGFDWV